MKEILFYEKPGCIGNRKQKALLRKLGYTLEVRNLLIESWTTETLRRYFGTKPVHEWFNSSAPKVKSGEIDLHSLDEPAALELMLSEPILICRPLLSFGDLKQSGFVSGAVLDYLGVPLEQGRDLQSCPTENTNSSCDEVAWLR